MRWRQSGRLFPSMARRETLLEWWALARRYGLTEEEFGALTPGEFRVCLAAWRREEYRQSAWVLAHYANMRRKEGSAAVGPELFMPQEQPQTAADREQARRAHRARLSRFFHGMARGSGTRRDGEPETRRTGEER